MPTHFTIEDLRKSACAHLNEHILNPSNSGSLKKVKRAKYLNEKVEWNGELFDSTKEYKRYRELLLLLKAGAIGQIQRQVKYLLIAAFKEDIIGKRGLPLKKQKTIEQKTEYWADFVYIDAATGTTIVEDVKSDATRKLPTYIIKRKLMKSIYNIQIKET